MFAVQEQLVESQRVHHQMEEELNKVRQVSPTCGATTVSISQVQVSKVHQEENKTAQTGQVTRCSSAHRW